MCVLQQPVLSLDESVLQEPVLAPWTCLLYSSVVPLDGSVLQQTVLSLDVFVLQ
jgi:hypothetical protein